MFVLSLSLSFLKCIMLNFLAKRVLLHSNLLFFFSTRYFILLLLPRHALKWSFPVPFVVFFCSCCCLCYGYFYIHYFFLHRSGLFVNAIAIHAAFKEFQSADRVYYYYYYHYCYYCSYYNV